MELAKSFYQVAEKRRTVRKFQDRQVEIEKLHRILEAGLRAPSYNHMREWHFIFLKDPQRRKEVLELGGAFSRTPDKKFLNETLARITEPYQREVYSYSVPMQERILLTVPEVLIVCFRMEKKLSEYKTLFELNNLASVWLLVENILLAMAAEGLFGVTMVPFMTSGIKKLLDTPDDFEIATFIPLGYPDKEPSIKQIQIDLKERIHIDKW